jgi:sulfite reductase (NADPH) flavoprotein alpha-component
MLATFVVTKVILAAFLVLAYIVLCVAVYWQYRCRHRPISLSSKTWLIAYATQTGNAHQLAQHTAKTLRLAGLSVQELPLAQLTAAMLQQVEHLLLIVSTYGHGQAPDSARLFVQQVMTQTLALQRLRYGLLALGSRHYAEFCAFGGELDTWLHAQGARSYFEYICVDNLDKQAVDLWAKSLSHCTQHQNISLDVWQPSDFSLWTINTRQLLNPNSLGAPVYYLRLTPLYPTLEKWQAGDVVQLYLHQNQPLRDYSISNITPDYIELLVRLTQRDDGSFGLGSGLLTTSRSAPFASCTMTFKRKALLSSTL